MITRGILIGEIIFELTRLQYEIDFRSTLGLTDINRFSEDFFSDVLNMIYDVNLINLNSSRSNQPGLDLGDEINEIAYQITSIANSNKVNETLEKITDEQLKKYKTIKILILGKKQGNYTAIKKNLKKKCSFETKNIIDLNDLSKELISLRYDILYILHKYFEQNFKIVITELEVPNKEGIYQTNLSDKLEITPQTFCKNGKNFLYKFEGFTIEEIRTNFDKLGKLPRITREFLKIITELGESENDQFVIDYFELKRKLHIPEEELREEISILIKRSFLHEPNGDGHTIVTSFDSTLFAITSYAIDKGFLNKIFVAMDFTYLDRKK